MNVHSRKKIILLGMMSKMPVAGVIWQTMQYLVGFQRLGYDAYYVEAHALTPSMFLDDIDHEGLRQGRGIPRQRAASIRLGGSLGVPRLALRPT